MYRLAVIDDEYATRQGLIHMLDWAQMDIEIIGEAEDGFAGQALVEAQKPDIIICDIRMPKLDGIAMVSQLRPRFPDLQIIFLSGHSEKAYLRSAIRFGAVDYLDKPVMREELAAVLETAKQRLAERHGSSPLEAFQAQVAEMLSGKQMGESLMPAGLPVQFDRPYQMAVFAFDLTGEDPDATGLFLQQHAAAFTRCLQEAFAGKAFLHPLGNQFIGYWNLLRGFGVTQLGESFARDLPDAWQHTALCISEAHQSAAEIPAAYQEALEANRSFFNGFGRCYPSDARVQWKSLGSDSQYVEQIIRLVEEHAFTRAAALLDSYVGRLRYSPVSDVDWIRKELSRLAMFLAKQCHPSDEAYQFTTLEQVKFRCRELEDIRAHLQELLARLVSSLDTLSSKGRVIYDVQRYIQANYAKELSVSDIAAQVYLTPTYLCYLYKKNTGKTLNEYVTEVKMQKAKELLKNHALKLSDVAEMLGFHSANYFTRTFTKQYGITPTAYRNRHL